MGSALALSSGLACSDCNGSKGNGVVREEHGLAQAPVSCNLSPYGRTINNIAYLLGGTASDITGTDIFFYS